MNRDITILGFPNFFNCHNWIRIVSGLGLTLALKLLTLACLASGNDVRLSQLIWVYRSEGSRYNQLRIKFIRSFVNPLIFILIAIDIIHWSDQRKRCTSHVCSKPQQWSKHFMTLGAYYNESCGTSLFINCQNWFSKHGLLRQTRPCFCTNAFQLPFFLWRKKCLELPSKAITISSGDKNKLINLCLQHT